ncbi:MAG: LytR/AlgR family response regulator transcription factor [Flavobacteriales bacterium]
MKNSTLLIVGVGVPSELTEVLAKAGCEVQRSDSPLAAAIALVRGDVDLVLMVGPQDEAWNDFTDAAFATGKLVSVESLIAIPAALANGVGSNGNGNGHSNGHGDSEDHAEAGMTISEVVELVQRRASTQHVVQDYIYTKVGNKLRKVSLDDILFIEVEGKYSALQVRDRKYNVKASLKDLLHKLPSDRFVRVSRNFVVNLNQIQHIDTFQYTVKVGDLEIPISRTYKEELMRHINLI